MILAITGGRYIPNTRRVLHPTFYQLESFLALLDRLSATHLLHGAAIGTDQDVAAYIARYAASIVIVPFPVDTSIDGPWPRAGNHRNRRMLIDGRAHTLTAFPGGSGTRNCVSEALAMGLVVWEWSEDKRTFVRVG